MLKLLLVDDHAVFREGLRALLDLEEDFEVVGEASRGDEAMVLAAETMPNVILLDLHLPDGNGAVFCRELLQICPAAKVLILSAYEDDEEVSAALISGASGYVLKTVSGERLADNIRSVYRGEVLLAPSVAATRSGGPFRCLLEVSPAHTAESGKRWASDGVNRIGRRRSA